MREKLIAYYQSLVRPVDEWGPFYPEQKMIDGTDVEMIIRKKRAHKTILAEAFESQNKNRFKFKKRKAPVQKKKVEGQETTGNAD